MSDRALAIFQALALTVSVVCIGVAAALFAFMATACTYGVAEACGALS